MIASLTRVIVVAAVIVATGANIDFTDSTDLQKPTRISLIPRIYGGQPGVHRFHGSNLSRKQEEICATGEICVAQSSAHSVQSVLAFANASDRAAFRSWFVLLADLQFDQPAAEVTDCAALVRFAYREALRAHTPDWARRLQLPFTPTFPDVRSGPQPERGVWPLFRVAAGRPDRFGEFVDARTLVTLNARRISRDLGALQPGDLLYFRQPAQSQPDHLMVFVGRSFFDRESDDWIVYHTGPSESGPGEVRKLRLIDLVHHPSTRWRPLVSNEHFKGVFRLAVL